MYIKSLEITKLHKVYNYNIEFNEDITILYGENGSGKTTILSILESILTTNISNLFAFEFEEIVLKSDEQYRILIRRAVDKENGLYLNITLSDSDAISIHSDNIYQNVITSLNAHQLASRTRNDTEIESVYPVIGKVRRMFNDLYLPVNRLVSNNLEKYDPLSRRDVTNFPDIDTSLKYAIDLIKKGNRIKEVRKNRYNQEFKNEILSTTLRLKTGNVQDIFENEEVLNSDRIDDLKNEYFKMLKNLGISENNEPIEQFIENYKKNIPKIINYITSEDDEQTIQTTDVISFIFDASEIMRMKKVLPIAEKLEKRLSDISKKTDNFLSIVNSFFEDSMERKELLFDNLGQPVFKIDGRSEKISLKFLSSGEKQIIILFANLIFTEKYSKSKEFKNIFVADEPEISLHMLWQMKLIPSILKSRKKLQIILATHSPEIVGEFEHKMFELKKERAANE